MRVRGRRCGSAGVAVIVAAVMVLGACSGGEDSAATTTTAASEERVAAETNEFCGLAEELGPELDQSEDFAAVVVGVEQLAAAAPEEIAGDLKVLAEAYRPLSGVDLESPEGFGRLFELASDPEVAAAAGNVDAFVSDACGVELGWSTDVESGTESGSAGRPIETEDVVAVVDANSGPAWATKLRPFDSFVSITGGDEVDITSAADPALTPDEALEACTALLAGLSEINPEVSIVIRVRNTALVGSLEGTCAPGDPAGVDEGLGLEDIDAVKDANSASSWAGKLQRSSIFSVRDVRVESAGEPALTAAEALEACTALLEALSRIEPAVTITVSADDTELAESSGGTCRPA